MLDPVMDFLLRNVRSKYVRQQFSKTPPAEYTNTQPVRLLVGAANVPNLVLVDTMCAGIWPGSHVCGRLLS